jgi:hypothetical protein
MADDIEQPRYLLTNLKYHRKYDTFYDAEGWSLYLVSASYDVLDVSKTKGLVSKFGKNPDFSVKKLLFGIGGLPPMRGNEYAGQYFKGSTFKLSQKYQLIKSVFNKIGS